MASYKQKHRLHVHKVSYKVRKTRIHRFLYSHSSRIHLVIAIRTKNNILQLRHSLKHLKVTFNGLSILQDFNKTLFLHRVPAIT